MSEISPVSETELLSKVPPVVLEFKNGIRIKVPDSINMITPYVIHEQGKWFEKEMQFLDAFLKPGMQAIDIGANYGVYTLSIARILGPEGRLWAFEPATSTKAYLGSSLAENNFENVELIQAALSNVSGTAKLSLNVNSELNEITDSPTSDYEEIPLLTLDKCRQDLNWESIDFIKIDAEGQEENILQGGRRLLDECSPLIMFEFKHKNKVNLSLIERFSNINYQTYRYVEGLGFLVPFKIDELPDPYELNLFGCKKDMARRLEEDGLLISTETLEQSPDLAPRENWQNYYTTMPYYKRLYGDREFTGAFTLETDRDVYVKALEQFSVAQSPEQTPIKRFLALEGAVRSLSPLEEDPGAPITRLLSLARMLGTSGRRIQEVNLLKRLIGDLKEHPSFNIEEPFIPACPRFDTIDPGPENLGMWLVGQTIEQLETRVAHSSYYSKESGMQNLEILSKTGFMSEAMQRRRNLIMARFGKQ